MAGTDFGIAVPSQRKTQEKAKREKPNQKARRESPQWIPEAYRDQFRETTVARSDAVK
jgi:hypothetical protein